jgi:hypothetical protein
MVRTIRDPANVVHPRWRPLVIARRLLPLVNATAQSRPVAQGGDPTHNPSVSADGEDSCIHITYLGQPLGQALLRTLAAVSVPNAVAMFTSSSSLLLHDVKPGIASRDSAGSGSDGWHVRGCRGAKAR